MEKPQIAIIISTYNAVEWLKKTLWGYTKQSFTDFELIIADDGSDYRTKALINSLSSLFKRPIVHVWHEDNGFQKSVILNKALLVCKADYILMSDGDCIPEKDFVLTHIKYRKPNYFLSGGYFKLPMVVSQAITREDIDSQKCFDINWLKSQGLKRSLKNKKLSAKGIQSNFLNMITPTKASWNGHNASGWKSDILAINGFDERMQYGGQDRELGERLKNKGVQSKQIRYCAICVHLDHARGYVKEEMLNNNARIRKETRIMKKTYTDYGIVKK
ncbi:glycosyltransferase family 2 protein [Leeuwenhoekiella polynyae]|nr:glycosyltransferase family 2 protein [Leeuwenhoekiella polynyae]